MAFHALLLSLVVALRAQTTLQLALLCILALLLVLSRRLNEFGKQNWRLFASRDYFDKGGLFLTAVWAVPLLLVMLVQVACGDPSVQMRRARAHARRGTGSVAAIAGTAGRRSPST